MKRLSRKASFAVAPPGRRSRSFPLPVFTLVECTQGNQRQNYAPASALFGRPVNVTGSERFSSCLDAKNPGLPLVRSPRRDLE